MTTLSTITLDQTFPTGPPPPYERRPSATNVPIVHVGNAKPPAFPVRCCQWFRNRIHMLMLAAFMVNCSVLSCCFVMLAREWIAVIDGQRSVLIAEGGLASRRLTTCVRQWTIMELVSACIALYFFTLAIITLGTALLFIGPRNGNRKSAYTGLALAASGTFVLSITLMIMYMLESSLNSDGIDCEILRNTAELQTRMLVVGLASVLTNGIYIIVGVILRAAVRREDQLAVQQQRQFVAFDNHVFNVRAEFMIQPETPPPAYGMQPAFSSRIVPATVSHRIHGSV